MNNAAKTAIRVKITPLTALHIGTGGEFSPFDYCIKSGEDGPVLMRFSLERIIENMSSVERKKLITEIDKNDIGSLQKYISGFVKDPEDPVVDYSESVINEIGKKYADEMANPNLRKNRLIINEMYRKRNTFKPVIPGSSIKGALRTAVLAYIMKKSSGERELANPYRGDPWSFEKDILKYKFPQNDPFRTLLIRDALVQGSDIGYVSRIDQYKKGGVSEDSLNTIPINVEIIRGKLTGSNAIAPAELLFDKALQNAPRSEKWNGFSASIDWELIRKACNDFYNDSFSDEYNNFYLSCDDSGINRVIEELRKEIDEIIETETDCVARIGRFSQIESMTVPARNPKKKYGSTRSLVRFNTGLYPLGWVRISLKDGEKKEDMKQGGKRYAVRIKGQ